jgi:hypothetical protein
MGSHGISWDLMDMGKCMGKCMENAWEMMKR